MKIEIPIRQIKINQIFEDCYRAGMKAGHYAEESADASGEYFFYWLFGDQNYSGKWTRKHATAWAEFLEDLDAQEDINWERITEVVKNADFTKEIKWLINWADKNAQQDEKEKFVVWLEGDFDLINGIPHYAPEDFFENAPDWDEINEKIYYE